MISASDILNGLRGVMAVGRGRPDWEKAFELTPETVFRSFWALPLALPFIYLSNEAQRRLLLENEPANPLLGMSVRAYHISQMGVSVLVWGLILTLLILLARHRDIGWRVGPLIMVQNWSQFLVALLLTAAFGVGAGGAMPVSDLLVVAVVGFSLWIDWGLMRRPMDFSPIEALGALVALNLIAVGISGVLMSIGMMMAG